MIPIVSASADSTARPAAFYARWIDHATWPEWAPDTLSAEAERPVRAGSRGTMRVKDGPALKFVVACADPDREYTDVTRMPGARIVFRHTAEPQGEGSRLGVEVAMSGPLARLWSIPLGKGFRTSVPADLERLVAAVEGA